MFAFVASAFYAAISTPKPLWIAGGYLVVGVSGVLLVASLFPDILSHVGVLDSIAIGIVGLMTGWLFADGMPAYVWRNLLTKGHDYAGRFFSADWPADLHRFARDMGGVAL